MKKKRQRQNRALKEAAVASRAFFAAATTGDLASIKKSLEQGQDVNALNEKSLTALALASKAGHVEVARALVVGGADMASKDVHGVNSLMLASLFGHLQVITFLVESYDTTADTAVDLLEIPAQADKKTALMFACEGGHLESVKYLVGKGASTERSDAKGETPLIAASAEGHLSVVQYLVEEVCVNVNTTDSDGDSALVSLENAVEQDSSCLCPIGAKWGERAH
jgi:ankyrin repeat protein